MEIVLLGHMGRDEALVDRLSKHKLHILGQWENPGLVQKAEVSGGKFHKVNSITDTGLIADYVQDIQPDMFLTNFDDALAGDELMGGVVDVIKQRVNDGQITELLIPCPDRATARIEWDKFFLRELIEEINPRYNPLNFMAKNPEMIDEAIEYFKAQNIEIAVKPRNLTGGKGVKVMGKHFATFEDGKLYALQVLADRKQTGVEIQEKLQGHEFTLQLFTDGTTLVKPPATYDYPYRFDGDEGPGTGGMGTFSMNPDEQLPFIDQADYDEASRLMEKLLDKLKERGLDYKGVLYPTFFKTPDGLKIVEINARGGDPEMINIVDLAEDDIDFAEVMKLIALGELAEDSIRYKKLATAMLYLVAPEYGHPTEGPVYEFEMDEGIISTNDCRVRFAAAERIGENRYRTSKTSRIVGLSAQGEKPWEARAKIHQAIKDGFVHPLPLQYRNDIAKKEYILGLAV